MSQNISFLFEAGGVQPPPVSSTQPQRPDHRHSAPSSSQASGEATLTHEMAFQQNARLPGVDMSALAGISPEQLALIARLFQAGALTLPPPPPGGPTPIPAFDGPSSPAAMASAPDQTIKSHATYPPTVTPAQEQDLDMDKEEGELEEGEVSDATKLRDFLRPPPTGPRKANASPRDPHVRQDQQKSLPRPVVAPRILSQQVSQHGNGHRSHGSEVQASSQSQPTQSARTNGTSKPRGHISRADAAKMFVSELVEAGYTFDEIVKEVGTLAGPLRRIFKELRLSTVPERTSGQPAQLDGTSDRPRDTTAVPASASGEVRKVSLAKRPAPAKAGTVDRSEYLARLQAAKNKKADINSAAASTSKIIESPTTHPQQPTQVDDRNASTNNRPTAGSKANVKNELIRQRLEELRAKQAAAPGSNTKADVLKSPERKKPSGPSGTGLGAGLADIATRGEAVADQLSTEPQNSSIGKYRQASQPDAFPAHKASSVAPSTPSQSFRGLPGLFMMDATLQTSSPIPTRQSSSSQSVVLKTGQHEPCNEPVSSRTSLIMQTAQPLSLSDHSRTSAATPAPSPAPLTVPRKRPVASDFDDFSSKPNSAKRRPFGQSKGASEDESIIIEISEDEYDDDMDLDVTNVSTNKPANQMKLFRDAHQLRDSSPPPNFQTPASTSSTPGAVTPGGAEYQRKMQAIEEMNRKIAEMERGKKMKTFTLRAAGGKSNLKSNLTEGSTKSNTPTPGPTISSRGTASETSPPQSANVQSAIESQAVEGNGRSASQEPAFQMHEDRKSGSLAEASFEKQQEVARLKQRIIELGRAEYRDVKEAVEAVVHPQSNGTIFGDTTAAAVGESTQLAKTSPAKPSPKQVEEVSREPQDGSGRSTPSAAGSEEGEISDGSMSNFYETQESTEIVEAHSAATEAYDVVHGTIDDSKVRSPSTPTGTSEMSNADTGAIERLSPGLVRGEQGELGEFAQQGVVETNAASQEAFGAAPSLGVTLQTDMSENLRDSGDDNGRDLFMAFDVEEEFSEYGDNSDRRHLELNADQLSSREDHEANSPNEIDYANNTVSSSASNTDSEDSKSESAATDAHTDTMSRVSATSEINQIVNQNHEVSEDLAPELQPPAEPQAETADQKPNTYFVSYESPLRNFKDYRYHPEYLNTVSGGFKSMTYSNNIDIDQPLCQYEAIGGKCNDKNCDNQHFSTMGLTDNDLLKYMGTKNIPIRNNDDLQRWNDGLSAIIQQLKNTPIGKDAAAIAAKIVEFRREFVGDPTQVLNLG